MDRIFYVYYAVSFQYYDWGVADEDGAFYRMVVDGTHYECCFEYQAEIKDKFVDMLKAELEAAEDDRALESIIQKYELMED